ncbi:hypothetical protein T484DRAFT_1878673 [Baffinella frigidus]|nr:hypothetical protein T484DRAFT_1878673 [Cryptophyta sp. CCMP2293]
MVLPSPRLLRLAAVAAAAACVVLVVGGSLRESAGGAVRRAEMISWTPAIPRGCEQICMNCVRYELAGYEMAGDAECQMCECGGSIPGSYEPSDDEGWGDAPSRDWMDENTWWWDAMVQPSARRFGTVEGEDCGDVCPKCNAGELSTLACDACHCASSPWLDPNFDDAARGEEGPLADAVRANAGMVEEGRDTVQGLEVPEWDREVTGPLSGEPLPDYQWMH